MNVVFLSRAEERALFTQALAGDEEARNRIVMGAWSLIYREAIKIAIYSGKEAEDLAQVGVEQVLRAFGTFDPELAIRASTYFVRVATNAMKNFAARLDLIVPLAANGGSILDADLGPDEIAAAKEENERLEACIAALPQRLQDMIRMTLDRKRQWEIARALGISPQLVSLRMKQAIKTLRRLMVVKK